MMKNHLKLLVMAITVLIISGCSGMMDHLDLHDETILPPSFPVDVPPPPKSNGSIYQAGYELSLFRDNVASRVGDILTIRLEESTQGEKEAKMKTTKTTNDNTNNGTGVDANGAVKPILLGAVFSKLINNVGSDLQFDGKGQTNQFNRLRGTISVTVTRVLSNNNLIVQGESWITINQGREYVRLTGIVRPADIDPSNTVSSQRLADARISYSGSGQVGNTSRGGLITQLLYKFFPF